MLHKILKRLLILQLLLCSVFLGRAQDPAKNFILSGTETGNKNYVARDFIRLVPDFHYMATTTESFTAKVDPLLVFPPADGIVGTAPGYPIAGDGIVGSIPGGASVSGTGGATYSIPIEIPAGIKGMQPNIAITYNSHAGNGLLGQGVNLGGLSAIIRTPDNPYYDNGNFHAVEFDANDKLALDGKRLLVTSGTYGTTNSTYTTENDPSTKITLIGEIASTTSYLKVETRGGITMHYGNAAGSSVVLPNQTYPYIWFLNKMEDGNGNYITYDYAVINGETVINTIEYTGNVSQAPFYKVKFNYIARTDMSVAYVDGSKMESKNLLENIEILYNTSLLKKYSFTYATDIVSRLTSISLENADGEHLNPNLLYWEEKNGVDLSQAQITCEDGVSGDFNNDGLSDLYAIVKDASNNYYEKLFINSNGQLGTAIWSKQIYTDYQIFDHVIDFNSDGKLDVLNKEHETEIISNFVTLHKYRVIINLSGGYFFSSIYSEYFYSDFKYTVGDFDGDGAPDIFLLLANGDAKLLRYVNSAVTAIDLTENNVVNSTFYNSIDKFYSGDYNGDGLMDLGFVDINGKFHPFTINGISLSAFEVGDIIFNSNNFHTGDFNGDGITDLANLEQSAYNIYFYKKSTTLDSKSGTPDFYSGTSDYGSLPTGLVATESISYFNADVFDVNQDGKADIVYSVRKEYTFKKLNNEYGSFNTEQRTFLSSLPGSKYYEETVQINDYYSEILATGLWSSFKVIISYGTGIGDFINTERIDFPDHFTEMSGNELLYMDLNGDGLIDLFKKHDNHYSLVSMNLGYKSYQLTKVVDGLNNSVEFNYKSLNNPSSPIYRQFYNAQFPVKDFIGPFMAVEKITRSNGVSNAFVEEYSYIGAKIHAQGKGFLGFTEVSSYNPATGVLNRNVSKLDVNYMTFVSDYTGQLYSPTSKLLKHVQRTGEFMPLGGKRYLYKLNNEEVLDGLNNITTQKNYTYDDYANVLTEQTITPDATILTTKVYGIFDAWCNNKVTSSTTSYTRGTENKTRTTTYDWDLKGNLTKETRDPLDKNELISEYLNYDEYGNARTIQATAKGYPARVKYLTYENGRFIKTSTNSLNQTTTFVNNAKWGKVDKSTDYKNRSTSYEYDNWGRLLRTKYPDGIYETGAMRWANGSGPLSAVYYSYNETTGSAPELTWFDNSGKELRKETKAFGGKQIYVDTKYDAIGRAHQVSDPYYSSGTSTFATTEYDVYGREIKRTLSTNDVVNTSYGIKTITVTGPNTNVTKTMNSFGETLTTTDNISVQSVSYAYFADGLVKSTTPSTGPAVTMKYDLQGNRTELIDPDAGTITSETNGFGDLIWQQDNKNNLTTNFYDAYGRIDYITRSGASTIDYIYNTDNQLITVSDGIHSMGYEYDGFERITQVTESIDSKSFVSKTEYDAYGRVVKETYPSGYYINNVYDGNGFLSEITDQNNTCIWKLNAINALGQFESVTKGNGLTTTYTYDVHHRPNTAITTSIAEFQYFFDPQSGNLDWRKDLRRGLVESFNYDNLNRLTDAYYGYGTTLYQHIDYYNNGNILSKTDAASLYSYNPAKPHAVIELAGPQNIPSVDQNISYTSFNKVNDITEGDYQLKFTYGIDNYRRKTQFYNLSVLTKTKYFSGNYELEVDAAANERKIHYIAGGDGLAAVFIIDNANPAGKLYYTYTDHLGSIVAITNDVGTVLEEQSFDPWGRRRNPADWSYTSIPAFSILDRGYTGHQHLYEFGIINMNGRLYDPVLGRMLSPDNYVQMPDFAQNFNRYSYCVNNPLKFTDPSGDFFWLPIIAGAAIYGTVNTIIHKNRGDIHNFGDGLGYFFQGAVVGAVAGATWSLGIAGITSANTLAQVGGWTIMGAKGISALSTITSSINNIENAGKILMGRAYTDENRSFFGAIAKGISRNTWESIQTWAGYNIAQIRNTTGKVDEVEYFGGVTFAIDENVSDFNGWRGASYGNYIMAKIPGELDRNHPRGWMFSEGGLFWHEYGHTTDSQIYGLSYLFTIGLSSAGGADWTEIRANRWAWRYAEKFNFMNTWLYPYEYPLN